MRAGFEVPTAKARDHKAGALLRLRRREADEQLKKSLPVSTAAALRPLAIPFLGQRLGKFLGNSPHRGNPWGNSCSQTAKARDNSRPAPTPNSPIPQNLRRNLKKKSPPQIQPATYFLPSRLEQRSKLRFTRFQGTSIGSSVIRSLAQP